MKKITLIALMALSLLGIRGTIDLNNLLNYAGQSKPAYIQKDNTPVANPITNAGATLGRVLFYDKNLSVNNTIACASCHQQRFAFGDTALQSLGLTGGLTGRHSMRLVNSRFAEESKFFWDERAASLEVQTSRPIQDHVEMGFSGANGDPDFDSLIRKMNRIDYYNKLFKFVYGDTIITETRIQNALAQFVRSIQSFDSKYDIGRAQAANDGQPFQNFTQEENTGKTIFLNPPPQGGAGCQGCHRAPEFDIDPQSLNNGITGVAGVAGTDLTNTRAPSLRDLFNPNGTLNGPMMHNGIFTDINAVINHYNSIPSIAGNANIDPRLTPGGQPQRLNLSQQQKDALAAFLKTLTGSNIYTDVRWSNPFDANGNINLVELTNGIYAAEKTPFSLYPNPATDFVQLDIEEGDYDLKVLNTLGQTLIEKNIFGSTREDLSQLPKGALIFQITDKKKSNTNAKVVHRN
jgi:cytochrome c peroxidase